MCFKLLDKNGIEVIEVTQLGFKQSLVKGLDNTPFKHIQMYIKPSELAEFKDNFNLFTKREFEDNMKKSKVFEYSILDLLISANFNLNKFNSGNLETDNHADFIGKQKLSKAVELLSKGYQLETPIN
ncbi:hypothetical protein IM157_01065 [Staphylococcus epidermidis]|nr:hypothetical protein [Staphylococcus epidermidis]